MLVDTDYVSITRLNEVDLPDNTRRAGMHAHYLQIPAVKPRVNYTC